MKQTALLTLLIGLFFGSLAVILAGPTVPPQQYYIRWKSPVAYTCTHVSSNDDRMIVNTSFDYYVPAGTQMSESDTTHSSYGDTGGMTVITDWAYGTGAGQHVFHGFQLDSKSYPMSAQVTIGTIINHALVYESTFAAVCTGSSNATLHASIVNNNRPLHLIALPEGNIGIVHP
ncbi:MAG TPA: hypothetical protein VHD90_02400 [Phototrophicaceae bacterium]|nr:hypothetical protein [Phototrophicaceae bacterium]